MYDPFFKKFNLAYKKIANAMDDELVGDFYIY